MLAVGQDVFDGSIFHLVDTTPITQDQLLEQYLETTGATPDRPSPTGLGLRHGDGDRTPGRGAASAGPGSPATGCARRWRPCRSTVARHNSGWDGPPDRGNGGTGENPGVPDDVRLFDRAINRIHDRRRSQVTRLASMETLLHQPWPSRLYLSRLFPGAEPRRSPRPAVAPTCIRRTKRTCPR